MNAKTDGRLLGADDGRQLAADLLREVRARVPVESLFAIEGSRVAQDNIAQRYLEALRALNSAEAEAAFASVITDFIASAYDGAPPDPALYDPTP